MRLFKRVYVFYQNRYRSSAVRTFMDVWWNTLLRLTFLLLCTGILMGGWMLYDAWRGITPAQTTPVSSESLSREALRDGVEWIAQKRVQYDAVSRTGVSVVDPGR